VFTGILVMITVIMTGISVDMCWRGLWENAAAVRQGEALGTVLGTSFRFLSLSV
jgi:mannose/fructose/N-acetylgalactosamine-specific phosphotransferase system component IIC